MHTETQAGLDASKGFLRDCIEVSQLMLRQKLEALRRGERVDVAETRAVMGDGRAAARQLEQVASLEVRDQALELRESGAGQKAGKRPAPAVAAEAHHSDGQLERDRTMLMEHSLESSQQLLKAIDSDEPCDYSPRPEIIEMVRRYGFDPDDEDSLAKVADILFPESVEA